MVTQMYSARQLAQGKTCLRQRLPLEMKNTRKVFTNASNCLRHEKKQYLLCTMYFSLSFFRCLSAVYSLPMCLSICVPVYARGQLFGRFYIRYLEQSLVQVFQKVFNIFNDLDPLSDLCLLLQSVVHFVHIFLVVHHFFVSGQIIYPQKGEWLQ